MKLTAGRKRLLARAAKPVLGPAYFLYRLLSRDLFRDHRLPPEGGAEPQRILVVRLDNIGDVLLSEPAIAALGARFSEAKIDLLARRAEGGMLAEHPAVSSLIAYDAPWHAAWRGARVDWRIEAARLVGLVQGLRQRRYDLAIELRGDLRDIAVMAATGARVKVGNSSRGGGFLLDHDVSVAEDTHRMEFALAIVSAVGAAMEPRPPRLHLPAEALAKAESLLPAGEPFVAFHLGAGFASKCLPVATFAVAAMALHGEGHRIVVVGGANEHPLVDGLRRLVNFNPIDLVGKLSILETAAVLGRCRLFIGNDSGPMHLAAAVGTPVVACFGPSDPKLYHPYGVPHRIVEVSLPCRPCDLVHCIHSEYRCMTQIPAQAIVTAARELLAT